MTGEQQQFAALRQHLYELRQAAYRNNLLLDNNNFKDSPSTLEGLKIQRDNAMSVINDGEALLRFYDDTATDWRIPRNQVSVLVATVLLSAVALSLVILFLSGRWG